MVTDWDFLEMGRVTIMTKRGLFVLIMQWFDVFKRFKIYLFSELLALVFLLIGGNIYFW